MFGRTPLYQASYKSYDVFADHLCIIRPPAHSLQPFCIRVGGHSCRCVIFKVQNTLISPRSVFDFLIKILTYLTPLSLLIVISRSSRGASSLPLRWNVKPISSDAKTLRKRPYNFRPRPLISADRLPIGRYEKVIFYSPDCFPTPILPNESPHRALSLAKSSSR